MKGFGLETGALLAGKYLVEERLGGGWEGEVYRVVERGTGIQRAFKLFHPERNPRNVTLRRYARKLDRLRRCGLVAQYYGYETILHQGKPIRGLVSELLSGPVLAHWVASRRGGRLTPFEALHLTYGLAQGIEEMHLAGEYHGDLHDENVIVQREGIFLRPKVFDFFHYGQTRRSHLQDDVVQIVRILYDAVGGAAAYRGQPAPIKALCCGLRNDLVRKRYPTASHLRQYLESFSWD